MFDNEVFRQRVQEAVLTAFSIKGEITTTGLVESLIVQLKPVVIQEQKAYTISELREMVLHTL